MKFRIFITGLLILQFITQAFSQQWIRIYGDSINTVINNVVEHYDNGYIFSGERYNPGYTVYGWILKTDINGNERWSKMFGNNSTIVRFFSSKPVSDGGIIEVGLHKVSTGCSDPLIIKTNACGDKEWCKIYKAPYCYSTCYDICLLDNGGYMTLMDHWKSGEEETIWLFKLDSVGKVIWAQVYATDPDFSSEWSHSLLKTNDSCVVITGQAYYPDPTYPGKSIIKIILIKVNLDGEAVFEVPWGTDNGVFSDGRFSVIDTMNNIYTAGRRARKEVPYGDSPCLFKTSATGNPVFYKDLKSTSTMGIATTINWFQDSTLAIVTYWKESSGLDTTGVIKTDSMGNFQKQKILTTVSEYAFWGSDITFNDKLILGGSFYDSGYFHGCAIKLTSDLEYDSIYTAPFTYDSLCPHPIVSDTTSLDDCEIVIVGIDDPVQNPGKTMLHVYPNPAENSVTLEMPEYLVRKWASQGTSGTGITATTYYYQWQSVRLDVFNLFGKLMYSQEVLGETDKIKLDISSWPGGMYHARLVFMNDAVASVKFVKQ